MKRIAGILALLLVAILVSVVATPKTFASPFSASAAKYTHICPGVIIGSARCHAIQVDVGSSASPSGYNPADLQSAYKLPSSTAGSGQTVAIVDAYDDPKAESDLGVYRTQFSLSACTTANGCFRKVNQTGGTKYPRGDRGWAEEISLDLDMVSAICPNCHMQCLYLQALLADRQRL